MFKKSFKKQLEEIAAQDRAAMLTEKDVEFLRSIGVNTDLETLRNGGRKAKKRRIKI